MVYLSNGTDLFTVNPGTGTATLIGPHLTTEPISGLSLRTEPACMIGTDSGSVLAMVPVVGAPTGLVSAGMEFDDSTGLLYVILGGGFNQLAIVDPSTGIYTGMSTGSACCSLEIVGACGGTGTMGIVPSLSTKGLTVLVAMLLAGALLMVRVNQTHREPF